MLRRDKIGRLGAISGRFGAAFALLRCLRSPLGSGVAELSARRGSVEAQANPPTMSRQEEEEEGEVEEEEDEEEQEQEEDEEEEEEEWRRKGDGGVSSIPGG